MTRPFGGDSTFAGILFLSPANKLLLLLLCRWSVLVGQLKQLSSCLAVQGLGEQVHHRRHFQALIENSTLPLQPNVVGPFDKVDDVPFGMDILSNAKILCPFLIRDLLPPWPPASSGHLGSEPPSSFWPSFPSTSWVAGGEKKAHFLHFTNFCMKLLILKLLDLLKSCHF